MNNKTVLLSLITAALIAGCSSPRSVTPPPPPAETMTDLVVPPSFDYATLQTLQVEVNATDQGSPLENIGVSVFTRDPQIPDEAGFPLEPLAKGILVGGKFSTPVTIPKDVKSVFVRVDYIFANQSSVREATIQQGRATFDFSSLPLQNLSIGKQAVYSIGATVGRYTVLGGWANNGVPSYLTTPETITSAFLNQVNSSLPEGRKISYPTDTSNFRADHPYIASSTQSNVILKEDAELWVSFVHEGAGYKNMLGYFIYDPLNPPTSPSDPKLKYYLAFPNLSYSPDGGMTSGMKVQLKYFDETGKASNRFPAGKAVGWFIVANGWNGSPTNGLNTYFSLDQLNPENPNSITNSLSKTNIKRHAILLKDDTAQHLMLGFEDLLRTTSGCDQDFNDAVFKVSATPYTAIDTSQIPNVRNPGEPDPSTLDTDKDGVADIIDQFPSDSTLAFKTDFPAQFTEGTVNYATLAFEDKWPMSGDYDFNDMVMNYKYTLLMNASNQVVRVKADFVLRAAGALYHNGFGFQLNVPQSAVKSVTRNGYTLPQNSYIKTRANGTEEGQTKGVVIVMDDVHQVLKSKGQYIAYQKYMNTQSDKPFITHIPMSLTVEFNTPQSQTALGTAPFNPFLISDGTGQIDPARNRGHEVHLPGQMPTDLADPSLFKTMTDNTSVKDGRTYVTRNTLPWVLNIPGNWDYPEEVSDLVPTYLNFSNWAQSGGLQKTNWYQPLAENRNEARLYKRPLQQSVKQFFSAW
ncbi:LruC domain-containing protein [Deinococcus misasensis]|uniref:LruC domain-containing protein n=1 Tax=Deinococcus misasensis TaxID=392413 RepID=UPI00054D245E|nr:LruC domain-containing protein [Deinococcus misasensis]